MDVPICSPAWSQTKIKKMQTTINKLMSQSQVGFGTSGARGLVKDMTDRVCYAYTLGFIQYLKQTQQLTEHIPIALAGDLRDSTPAILNACARAIKDSGIKVINTGFIPTPAVALYGLQYQCPVIMVTGSHIPDDRNGIKFYKLTGEILKEDERLIKEQIIDLPDAMFNDQGQFVELQDTLGEVDNTARDEYIERYRKLFSDDVSSRKNANGEINALSGLKVGVYQHSGVARDILPELLEQLGAEVIKLGYSQQFIPVDTEAVREEDVRLARQWVQEFQLDAIVSTDGDADRPLIADETGRWLRGDIAGLLCARYLHIEHLVTPVSSNTCAEKSGAFTDIKRTRIGSPYVIEAMNDYVKEHCTAVAGYEANGGFLLATPVHRNDYLLSPLPTRDAVVVLLSLLHAAVESRCSLSELSAQLPQRFTYSARLKNFATETSQQLLEKYTRGNYEQNKVAIETDFPVLTEKLGSISAIDTTDGLRISFENEDIIHFRPSGNAPEFRCYSESDSETNAEEINRFALQRIQELG